MNSKEYLKPVVVSTLLFATEVFTQEIPPPEPFLVESDLQIEETVVLGRLRSAAGDIVLERMESESVVDILGADAIQRIGDSTVAAALTRVPGITLIGGQYVYVRGLGERYSSSLLNGATVPSPDLTRNVLPLDIFPSSILESVAIEKGFTSDMPAAFGGGNIDIRTKGIPEDFVFSLEIGTSYNTDSTDIFTYAGGGDDSFGTDDGTRELSSVIDTALNTYYSNILTGNEPSLSGNAIQATLARENVNITDAEADAMNAALALEVYRDLDITEKSNSFPTDLGLSASVGNLFEIDDLTEFGFLASLSYDNSVRVNEQIQRRFDDPEQEFQEETQTTENVSITGNVNLGLRWGYEHEVTSTNLFLRNTDDDVSVTNIYNTTSPFSSGQGSRNYDYRFEERELTITQLGGTHSIGDNTQDLLGIELPSFVNDMELTWFYSDAEAITSIPSETNILANITRDTETNEIVASTLTQGLRMVDVRYTDLLDKAESTGWELRAPFYFDRLELTLSGGAKFDRKARSYSQLDLSIGSSTSAAADTLRGSISEALSDENLTNPDFEYITTYQSGLSRSYIAATTTDAYFGQLDLFLDYTWRLTLGARYEEYKQFSSPWQPYNINQSQLEFDPSVTNSSGFPEGIFYEDEIYPSIAFTYSRPGFLGADDFNFRLGASESIVRPDLREVTEASYLDPRTDIIVEGNPDVVPSDLTNYDMRAEWFFGNGDNLTFSAFYKEILNPIEYFQGVGAEDTITASIENAALGESTGIEIEWLKSGDFLGSFMSQFFFSGNLTLAESELQVGDFLEVDATNRVRPLRGASEYVVNLQFGYDSDDGKHAATIAYNVFGERVFAAGVGEQPDSYEQPFSTLDLSYSYFPTYNLTLKAKLRNLLDENLEITQGDVVAFEQTVGQTYSFDIQYDF